MREVEWLSEIDKEVTIEGDGKLDPNDLKILNVTRTVSIWARDKAFKAGQIDDPRYTLCGEEVEDILHCWTCKAL